MTPKQSIVPIERIKQKIILIRNQKVMLDADLAKLYGVETKVLLQAVKRNLERFPEDFMFQINKEEFNVLRSQFVTSKGQGGRRYLPYTFTKQGVAMLSNVLRSKQAIEVNIAIMRAFVRLRRLMATHKDLARKLEEMEKKYNTKFKIVFEAIHQLMASPEKPHRPIGFQADKK